MTHEEVLLDKNDIPIIKYIRQAYLNDLSVSRNDMTKNFEIWFCRSNGSATINNNEYTISYGDIFIFSEDEERVINFADGHLYVSILQIPSRNGENILTGNKFLYSIDFFSNHTKTFERHILFTEPVARRISELTLNIDYAFADKKHSSDMYIIQQVLEILIEITENTDYCDYSAASKNTSTNTKQHKAIKRITNYIETHISEDISLNRLAEISNLSPNYLSNIFRYETGVKLWDYITDTRIEYAKKLLVENQNDTIISVAMRCGYNNCPNFNRAFKKETGMTPKKYQLSVLRKS